MNNHKSCPKCGNLMHRQSKLCRSCSFQDPEWRVKLSRSKSGKPSYVRTSEHKRLMSSRVIGIPKKYPTGGSLPGVADKIRRAWTQEMRQAAYDRGIKNAQDSEWRLHCGSPGEKNPMWEDGRAQMPYTRGWSRKIKELAWIRAGYHCEICESSNPRDTHHKDFRKDNHSLDNLQVLCRKCHKRLHSENKRAKIIQDYNSSHASFMVNLEKTLARRRVSKQLKSL